MKRAHAAILMAGAATVVPLAGTASAADAPRSSAAAQKVLECSTAVDGQTGAAYCENHTQRAVAFRATVVCGWAPDVAGKWVTLNPGQEGWSRATCAPTSSGAGSADWDEG
ncbi:hypothetical protein ACQEU8_19885 [Streptomyces sp. CA-250714]|uniref:hypothetical protein n=1 Tax=Streptomyces sp. CA-250714 TaxID=3240060 RepID=UPI003D91F435